jgi:hypothetical protein
MAAAITHLVRIDMPYACFGMVVVNGVVTEAAPIARWSIGRRGRDSVRYWKKRGAKVQWTLLDGSETVWEQ